MSNKSVYLKGMSFKKSRSDFYSTEEGKEIKRQLVQMVTSNSYNTTPIYSPNGMLYPDNLEPFVDKHMKYLISHPSLDARQYLANVKLATKVR